MDHGDHVRLLRRGVVRGGDWADIGAGSGAFTLALADLLGGSGEIVAVDRDAGALRRNSEATAARFPATRVRYEVGDFTDDLGLADLAGIVMANALHFVRAQEPAVRRLRTYLRPGGRLVIVEYEIQRGNGAVPHPVPYVAWERLARAAGFVHTERLERRPSRFLREIYSAVSW